MKQSFKRYLLIQIILTSTIFLFVYFITYYTYSNKSDAITSNIRNDLLVGDFKNVQLNIKNSNLLGYDNVIILNTKKQIILSANLKEKNLNLISITKTVKSSQASNNSNYTIIFKYSLSQVINNSFLFSLFFATLTIPFISYENKRLNLLLEKQKNIEKNNELKKAALQLSHDIRSPLATLNTISENLTSSSKEDLKLLKLSINRINQISNSLLDHGKDNIIKFNLTETVSNLIELKKIEHPKSKIDLIFEKQFSYFLTGNKTEFERMLSNLINNSIEASSAPEILVCINKTDNKLSFSIKDNGSGIPQEIIANLGKKNITTKENGNGLGLSHAYQTAKEMKAEFKIDANSHGTKIEFLFDQFEQMEQKSNLSVLLDDDELTRMNWEYKAKKANKELLIFKNKDELYSQLDNFDKSTTFYVDSELGNIKGEEIAKDLNQKGFTTIYMASGHSSDHFQELTFLKGVIDKNPPF